MRNRSEHVPCPPGSCPSEEGGPPIYFPLYMLPRGRRDPCPGLFVSCIHYICMDGWKEGILAWKYLFIGKDSASPKGDGRICQTKPPEENITESVKEIHVQTLASVKHSRIFVWTSYCQSKIKLSWSLASVQNEHRIGASWWRWLLWHFCEKPERA